MPVDSILVSAAVVAAFVVFAAVLAWGGAYAPGAPLPTPEPRKRRPF